MLRSILIRIIENLTINLSDLLFIKIIVFYKLFNMILDVYIYISYSCRVNPGLGVNTILETDTTVYVLELIDNDLIIT